MYDPTHDPLHNGHPFVEGAAPPEDAGLDPTIKQLIKYTFRAGLLQTKEFEFREAQRHIKELDSTVDDLEQLKRDKQDRIEVLTDRLAGRQIAYEKLEKRYRVLLKKNREANGSR